MSLFLDGFIAVIVELSAARGLNQPRPAPADRGWTAIRIRICRCEGLPPGRADNHERAANRGRLRRTVRRSTSSCPPQIPLSMPFCSAQSKHSTRTGHSAQTRLACSTCVRAGPLSPHREEKLRVPV